MNGLPGAHAALAATPGATLAAARQAEGLSVADVATQMRISPRQVEAIEADRYQELPGDVFVRGFIRNYARMLKLDPVPLLHALEPELKREVPLRAHEITGTLPTARRSRKGIWIATFVLGLAALLGTVAAYEWWRLRSSDPIVVPAAPEPDVLSPQLVPLPEGPAPPAQSIPLTPEPVPDTTSATPAEPVATLQGAATPEAKANVAAGTALQPTVQGGGEPGRVAIDFERESWIEIRDGDGKLIFMGTGAAGSNRRFEARPPIAMVVGNAVGVRITYNGQPFDLASHSARNIARFTLE
jgi:cytoskeleton protein RodZ